MTDITACITLHREGLLAGPALRSYFAAIERARAAGLIVEPLAVLDRVDATTQSVIDGLPAGSVRMIRSDDGDPACVRNRGVAQANGTYVAFLDGDDLWSPNWLHAAHAFCLRNGQLVAHSEMNVVFGLQRVVWWHADSLSPGFDASYQLLGNQWDAMCFTTRQTLCNHPYLTNDLDRGYGHEDWHWNNLTLEAGIAHRPVPGTIHFKRRRPNSQLAVCIAHDAIAQPSRRTRMPVS